MDLSWVLMRLDKLPVVCFTGFMGCGTAGDLRSQSRWGPRWLPSWILQKKKKEIFK